jgi:hypothetical protein
MFLKTPMNSKSLKHSLQSYGQTGLGEPETHET